MPSSNRRTRNSLKFIFMTGLFCQSCLCFAQNAPAAMEASASSAISSATPEKPIYTSSAERDNELLVKAFTAIAKTEELLWLTTPDEKVLSLYKVGETRKTLGLLLIMHAPEVPQLWPANLENIRRNLPLYSWSTIALPLPGKYAAAAPRRDPLVARTPATEPGAASSAPAALVSSAVSSESSSEESKPIVARDKLIGGRVTAAVGEFNKLEKLDLAVLVDNSSAPDALAALYQQFNIAKENTAESALKALVLVNMHDQEPLTKPQLAAIFASGNLRVMDVFFNPDNNAQAELRRLHKSEAMRQNVKDYQQLILPMQPNVTVEDTQSFWLGKIHGFLNKNNLSSKNSSSAKAGQQ